jgi:hypothetical protein
MHPRLLLSTLPLLASLCVFAADTSPPAAAPKTSIPWSNAGRATPTAAFVTATWANLENKTDVAVESVCFSEQDMKIFEEIFTALPENARASFKTSARMTAMVMSSLARRPVFGRKPPTGCEILGQKDQGADEVLLNLRFDNDARVHSERMKKFGDGWKLIVPSTGMGDKRRRDHFEKTAREIGSTLKP